MEDQLNRIKGTNERFKCEITDLKSRSMSNSYVPEIQQEKQPDTEKGVLVRELQMKETEVKNTSIKFDAVAHIWPSGHKTCKIVVKFNKRKDKDESKTILLVAA